MEYSSSQTCLTVTGTHVSYEITQCYLPIGSGDLSASSWVETYERAEVWQLAQVS